ncbi:MAG: hypothetical protein ABI949_14065 [Ilumatobacteraceae bacterium]
MTTPRRSIKSAVMFSAVVVTAGAALIVPTAVSAANTSTTPDTTARELPARYQRACLRIPNIEMRTTKFVARLNGDAGTRGSLLWLQAHIDDATAKGRTQLVAVLQNRLKVRTETLKVLTVRQERLTKLADLCRSHGVDV